MIKMTRVTLMSFLIATLAAGSCAADGDQTGTPSASSSGTGSIAVSARVISCERTADSVSLSVTFASNHSTEPLRFSSVEIHEPIVEAIGLANQDEVEFELRSTGGLRIVDRVELKSVTLIVPGGPLTLNAPSLEGLATQSVRTPIGIGRIALVRVENGSPLVSIQFAPQALGQTVLGAGAGNAILRLGDTQRAVTGRGLTPLHDGYVELLTFPRFSSVGGQARLELGDWQIIVPSLSVRIPC
jgi:hypothetical protein